MGGQEKIQRKQRGMKNGKGNEEGEKVVNQSRGLCNSTLVLLESLVSATFNGGSLLAMDFFTLSMYLSISAISCK